MRFFITGTAGFIGYHVAARLLREGHEVRGVDNFNSYYDPSLKEARNAHLASQPNYTLFRADLQDFPALNSFWQAHPCDVIIHLAAQAGVRYSLENPRAYTDSNLIGTFNIMELARLHRPRHFLMASTSSIYGASAKIPFQEIDKTDAPLTLYAASKKAAEAMTHSYAHLWNIPTTLFRFFTVYGPWGRPDMAPQKFAKGIIAGEPIDIYNFGDMERDFTFIDDLVEAIIRLVPVIPPSPGTAPVSALDSLSPHAPHRIVNIGGGAPMKLLDFIEELEKALGRQAQRNYLPMQPGDVPRTFADARLLEQLTGYRPSTTPAEGVPALARWYRDYYHHN